jgi:hypothetical protein
MKVLAAFFKMFLEHWAFWILAMAGLAIAALGAAFIASVASAAFELDETWKGAVIGASFFGLLFLEVKAYEYFASDGSI